MDISKRFYHIWSSMIGRCNNKNHQSYKHYGARGIKVSKDWLKYENFESDMYEDYVYRWEKYGFDRKMTSLDRIDNDKGYSKENCRWATQSEQCRNKRPSRLGAVLPNSILQKCLQSGVKYETVRARIKRGWEESRALSTPTRVSC